MSLRRLSSYMPSVESVGMSELEKYLDREKTARSKGEEAVDAFNVKVEQEYEMQQPETAAAASDTSLTSTDDANGSTDASSADTKTDTPTESSGEVDPEQASQDSPKEDQGKDKKEEDKKEKSEEDEKEPSEEESDKPAKESFRDTYISKVPLSISKEDFSEPSSLQKVAGYVGSKTWGGIKASASYLSELGIEYGPTIASKVYHGVLFVIAKLSKLIVVGIGKLASYRYRHKNSYEELMKKIESTKQIYENLQDTSGKEKKDHFFTNEKIINDLKVGSDVDMVKNVENFTSFVKDTIISLDIAIREEIAKIKHMAHLSSQTTASAVMADLLIDPSSKNIVKGVLAGYEEPAEYVDSYISTQTVCGDIRLVGYFPKNNIKDVEEMRKAYNESKMFIGLDSSNFKQIDSIVYLDKKQVGLMLDKISILCGICLQHQQLYEKLLKEKSIFKSMLKSYFNALINSNQKLSLKDTSLELMYLKTAFVDKVYIPAAMDVHETCIKIINSSLTLCNESMKGWK